MCPAGVNTGWKIPDLLNPGEIGLWDAGGEGLGGERRLRGDQTGRDGEVGDQGSVIWGWEGLSTPGMGGCWVQWQDVNPGGWITVCPHLTPEGHFHRDTLVGMGWDLWEFCTLLPISFPIF